LRRTIRGFPATYVVKTNHLIAFQSTSRYKTTRWLYLPMPTETPHDHSAERFSAASSAPGFEIPRLSAALLNKDIADLRHLQLLK
jgi:hypothetical protein